MFCDGCGRRTLPNASGLCDACLRDAWSELRQRANLWDLDALRATVDERPVQAPRTPRAVTTRPGSS